MSAWGWAGGAVTPHPSLASGVGDLMGSACKTLARPWPQIRIVPEMQQQHRKTAGSQPLRRQTLGGCLHRGSPSSVGLGTGPFSRLHPTLGGPGSGEAQDDTAVLQGWRRRKMSVMFRFLFRVPETQFLHNNNKNHHLSDSNSHMNCKYRLLNPLFRAGHCAVCSGCSCSSLGDGPSPTLRCLRPTDRRACRTPAERTGR